MLWPLYQSLDTLAIALAEDALVVALAEDTSRHIGCWTLSTALTVCVPLGFGCFTALTYDH